MSISEKIHHISASEVEQFFLNQQAVSPNIAPYKYEEVVQAFDTLGFPKFICLGFVLEVANKDEYLVAVTLRLLAGTKAALENNISVDELIEWQDTTRAGAKNALSGKKLKKLKDSDFPIIITYPDV